MTPKELEDRLIDFAVLVVNITGKMSNSYAAKYYAQQLLRSGSSPALNYGETRAAESRKDFIHKVSIILKELRESHNCLKIIKRTELSDNPSPIEAAISESNELISIFVASTNTAKKNLNKQ
jgi:four helix bundle protein